MKVKLSLAVVVCLFSVFAARAQTSVSVNEEKSSIRINQKTADVSLVVNNASNDYDGEIALEILDEKNFTRSKTSQTHRLKKGENIYKIPLPLGDLVKNADDNLAWYRLRYRIGDISGVVSLSELIKDFFDLRAAASEQFFPGQNYRIRVRALDPFTKTAVKSVKIKGELELEIDTDADEDELILKAEAETDGEGFAVLNFMIPIGIKFEDDGDWKITGRKYGLVREIEEYLDSDEKKNSVFITIDKPMYQPGQSFNVRGLYLDESNTVVTDGALEFKIKDEDGTTLYTETVKTSAFGIASVSWKIPENAKLGTYRVEIENDDGDDVGEQSFKVSRYDLPNFSVAAKPDKTFYLPNNNQAEITVSADYLFGKPVTKGRVRVVQENERNWNYLKQKYDTDEKNPVEGATDADGKFIARFDLTDEHKNLNYENWKRFKDLHFAAYYTDLTTNRTEQRRFDVRLTREPIHVYLVGNNNNNRNPNLPFTAYVSTFYADGTPAKCDVTISGAGKTVGNLKTNALGAGKLDFKIPAQLPENRYYELKITARDNSGQSGAYDENFYLNNQDGVKIRLEKTIFKPGENLKIGVVSTKKDGFVYLDVLKDSAVIESRFVKIEDGKGEAKIPYNPNFKGKLTVAVYDDETEGSYYYYSEAMRDARGIVYPAPQNLQLGADFSAATYKPGEEAKVNFSVLDGIGGKSAESALGVVVFDKAIEERARTDAEFGSYFSRFYGLLGYAESFGGITVKDLNELDLSKDIAPEIQLAAEIMLAGNSHYPRIYHSGYNETEPKNVYAEFFKKQIDPLETVLKQQYQKNYEHPTDEKTLRDILSKNGFDFENLRDPWGNLYVPAFSIQTTQNILTLNSAGADKKSGTNDDFAVSSLSFAYFTPTGQEIGRAIREYYKKTGKFVRDEETLSAALAEQNFDLNKLKDRWNNEYKIEFKVSGRNYQIVFRSVGANGFYERGKYNADDFDVWTSSVDYFAEIDFAINKILAQTVNSNKRPFPTDEAEFKKILKENNLDFSTIADGFGNPVYLAFDKKPRYSDKITAENGKQKIAPVTEEVLTFYIKSEGVLKNDARDDFVLTTFSGVINEKSKDTKYQVKNVRTVVFAGAKGAIGGTVFDPNGAVIPNAYVTATDESDNAKVYSANADGDGNFLLENLNSGTYTVRIESPAFSVSVYTNIEVRPQTLVEMSVTLSVGGVSETVEVTSSEASIEATESQTSTLISSRQLNELPKGVNFSSLLKVGNKNNENSQMENSTPRLREYFPETLVWSPEVLTDKNGRAELKFKMADNITTWKMYTIASTKNGKIGIAEKEVQAFQPFFVDLEPPKFLTDGDEIFLPAQVRNYTDKKQKVDVSMAKSDWFSFLNSEKQQIEIAPNASENAVFGFKANAAVKNGKQRVTALGAKESDAIEKPVTVKPNGQEIVKTESKLFGDSANFEINFPANALPKTPHAEVKIYPNLFSHVTESVEGLLQRPYGCGEQTISSTYPNLMILKFTSKENKLRNTAQEYLQKGYERLLGYQVYGGGFSYWGGKSEPDIALTAYAIRFLSDARAFIKVDETVYQNAINWLVSQQRADGSFTKSLSYEKFEDARRTKMFTAYAARILASTKTENGARQANVEESLQKALAYLKTRNAEMEEPYTLALVGLASFGVGNVTDAKAVAAKLETMAIAEGETAYWNLETNTPFYGWGTAGRIETTALVIQLLKKINSESPSAKTEDLVSKGTMFLLKNKDRYGVWYSTQTTINVLDAFLTALGKDQSSAQGQNEIQIALNGEVIQSFAVSPDQIAPITFDLKDKLNAAQNNLQIKSSENSPLMTQIVQTHYIDWRDADISGQNANESRLISLEYKCDKQTAEIMQEISCEVETERVGFKGYGMLLAEIGVPPGADVSRESLQAALDADSSLSRYDILPDRIIFYMWSKPGGTKFNFKFRPRYGVSANTPPSVIYDYYNDEAKATVAPMKFTVK